MYSGTDKHQSAKRGLSVLLHKKQKLWIIIHDTAEEMHLYERRYMNRKSGWKNFKSVESRLDTSGCTETAEAQPKVGCRKSRRSWDVEN